jgi:peroxisomal coenzyme A diphosphatase NUDT7
MGAVVDAYFAVADISSLDECVIDTHETERIFSAPVSYFENTLPEEYESILKVEPFEIDENGKTKILFPSKELGLPERYHSTWGNARHKIFVYRYNDEIIWGITARIIREIVSYLV